MSELKANQPGPESPGLPHWGRVAIITGGARGLGKAIALRLAKEGADIALFDVLHDELQSTGAEIEALGRRCLALTADVSREADVTQAVAQVHAQFGRIDILVNNAAISPKHDGRRSPVESTELAEWERVLAVNLTGPFLCIKSVIPHMKSQGYGRIINISSIVGRAFTTIAGVHYAATKSGIIGLSRVVAGDVGPFGITVNCVAPGMIQTPLQKMANTELSAVGLAATPVGRIGQPGEIAAAVSYLAGEETGLVTGAVLDMNGGRFMT